jgi:hypothetical protein
MKLKGTGNKETQSTKTNKTAPKGTGVLKVKSKVKTGGNMNSLGKHELPRASHDVLASAQLKIVACVVLMTGEQ